MKLDPDEKALLDSVWPPEGSVTRELPTSGVRPAGFDQARQIRLDALPYTDSLRAAILSGVEGPATQGEVAERLKAAVC